MISGLLTLFFCLRKNQNEKLTASYFLEQRDCNHHHLLKNDMIQMIGLMF